MTRTVVGQMLLKEQSFTGGCANRRMAGGDAELCCIRLHIGPPSHRGISLMFLEPFSCTLCSGASLRLPPIDQPVESPTTNQPKRIMPMAKAVSPMERDQRMTSRAGVCRNSADRAYHMPCSTLAQVCARPTGRRLIKTMRARPILIDQKAYETHLVFQSLRMVRSLRLSSVRPRPRFP